MMRQIAGIFSRAATTALFQNAKRNIFRMERHKVVPDVIPVVPQHRCAVQYDNCVCVDMGNILTPTQVQDPPVVKWEYKEGKHYTLCMTDPDAPSRRDPKYREWHHWLVVNIAKNHVLCGDVLSEYISSAPPKGTGLHRYVFVVYEQPETDMTFNVKKLKNNSGDGRAKFSITKFAMKHKFSCPHAGNFFRAEWDEYVPEVYKQLGA